MDEYLVVYFHLVIYLVIKLIVFFEFNNFDEYDIEHDIDKLVNVNVNEHLVKHIIEQQQFIVDNHQSHRLR